ncbi:hypothetical protein ACQP25_44465 (plasmid) [Microtetraspora malaysiensis]|uniref:hypothetical protein n=1 Tax=Microtetraspora malaysiensis TaxID=161358 RepID=UPI003D90DCB7
MIATVGAVSLTASTTKTVLGVKANAAFGLDLKKLRVGFGGTSGAPATVGLYSAPFTSNGTSTSVTPNQVYGRTITHGMTAGQNYTADPNGTPTLIESWPLTPNGGLMFYDIPLGDTPDCAPNTGFLLMVNSPVDVSCWASMWVERC